MITRKEIDFIQANYDADFRELDRLECNEYTARMSKSKVKSLKEIIASLETEI
jgi:hypothetical protein